MINNGNIIVQIGTKQQLLRDRETYPKELCDYIENIITCNSSELSSENGEGRIRFNSKDNSIIEQLSIINGNCRMLDESSSLILIRLENRRLKSCCYYGVDCEIDFDSNPKEYYLGSSNDCIKSLRNFYNSWIIRKGRVSAVVLIVDDFRVFEKIICDDFFKCSYILYSE